MTEVTTPQPGEEHSKSEQYTHGYSQTAIGWLATRTADNEGGFFLSQLQSGMRVLDVGCGPGTITLGIADTVAPGEVIGVDISENSIEEARGNISTYGIPNIRFEVADAYELPFSDDHFDGVFSNGVLEHLREPERALKEIHRVLKPGGVVGVRDSDWGGVLITPYDGNMADSLELRERIWRANGGNPHTGRLLKRFLQNVEFTKIEVFPAYHLWGSLSSAQEWVKWGSEFFTEQSFVDRATELGWVGEIKAEEWAKAWLEWGESEDAFYAYATCSAIGWKE